MLTYLLYFVITVVAVLLLALYSRVSQIWPKRLLLAGSFLSLYIPILLRGISVGTDYIKYRETFYEITGSSVLSDSVISWLGVPFIYLTQTLAPLVSSNYILFYGLISLVSLLFLYAAILRSKMPWLSLLLFITFCLYFQMFNQIRQMAAICILLYSIRHIQERALTKFLLSVGLASIFHMTAILFLPMYILGKAKLTHRKPFIYITVGVALATMSPFVIHLVSQTPYGATYLGSGLDMAFTLNTVQNFAVRLAMLIGCLLFLKTTVKKYPESLVLYNLVIYCTLIQILAMYSSLFGRLTTMFFVAYILLIPMILMSINKGWPRQKALLLIVIAAFMYQYTYYTSSSGAISGGYDQYKTIIQGEEYEKDNTF